MVASILKIGISQNTIHVEIFEWLNYRKKLAVSNFENSIWENGARV